MCQKNVKITLCQSTQCQRAQPCIGERTLSRRAQLSTGDAHTVNMWGQNPDTIIIHLVFRSIGLLTKVEAIKLFVELNSKLSLHLVNVVSNTGCMDLTL